MSAPAPYVVQSPTMVTWGGTFYVGPRAVVSLVPGSPLYNAYGGAGNLAPLYPLRQQEDTADHSWIGD